MLRKIISLGVILIMSFTFGACRDYVYQEDDFSLTITVDKTELRVGDTIEVTATLKNLSGRKHKIVYSSSPTVVPSSLSSIVLPDVFPQEEKANFIWYTNIQDGVLEIGASIENIITWEVQEDGEYYAQARAVFCIVKHYHQYPSDRGIEIDIYSEEINIIIQE